VVNLAARVVREAEPGEVLVADPGGDMAQGSPAQFESVGSRLLKGFVDPVPLYRVVPHTPLTS
jgi:class 3 adenylate cyclase